MTPSDKNIAEIVDKSAPPDGKHIVDILIEERANKLVHRPVAWKLVRRFLYPVLQYRHAVKMADHVGQMSGEEVFIYLSRFLKLNVEARGVENVPPNGGFILVSNHPTGLVDAIALWDAMKVVRKDLSIFANRDAVRVCPGLLDMLIPVEWVAERRTLAKTRETLKGTKQAFQNERCVVIFPSGRIAYITLRGLWEHEWMITIMNLVRTYQVPVLPVNMRACNSMLYYFFHQFNEELRNMTLFYEVLNKKNATYKVTFGELLQPDDLAGEPQKVIRRLRRHVVRDLPRERPWKMP